MQKIALITDSACDLDLNTLRENNVNLLPLRIIYSHGDYQDKLDITPEEIYLNLDKENIELAKLIGLLHDIGRFEQIKQYNTFSDKDSIDHGKLGVEILFKQGKIRNFIKSAKYDEIIKKAILNHNRKEIEKGLNPKELLHSKIIRDADKIDILYIMTFEEKRTVFQSEDQEVKSIGGKAKGGRFMTAFLL